MAYTNITGRPEIGDVAIPDEVSQEIIKYTTGTSTIRANARAVPMSKKRYKQPVLSKVPKAYWVNGDTGLKQTTDFALENLVMTAEEMAVIVPIPDAVVDDSDVPLWGEVKPLIAEAMGGLLDEAAIFGTNRPDTWPEGLVPGAIKSGQTHQVTKDEDLGVAVAKLGETMAANGVAPTSFLGRPGLNWNLVGLRDKNAQPIYTSGNPATSTPASLYGYPMNEVTNGAWDPTKAELIAVDWSKVFVGIRQDITFDMFKEGVITDENGKVLLNLMQQDTQALRVVFRVGFQVANPLSPITKTKVNPAGVITPAAAPKSGGQQ